MSIFERGLLSRLFQRHTKSADRDETGAVWQTIYPSNVVERNLLANNKEWVFIAVDKVALATTAVRFKVMRYRRSGDDQEVFDHPLVDFLESPVEGLTGKDFIYLNTAYKELTGNAFWELLNRKRVRPLIPTAVRPVIKNGELLGYKYSEDGRERAIPVDDVLHDRYADPRKPYWGAGKLERIARWVDTSSYANEFLRLFFVNGAQFGGFITTEEESEERIKLIKAGLVNEHTGVENAHKLAVLPKGSDYKEATANMSEMQFRELDEQYRDKILSGFGVPKTLVGLTTEVNRASAEASEYIFAKYTVKPVVDDLVEFLNTKVAPLFDSSGTYYFAYDEFIPDNMDVKLREQEIALNKQPYKTVNEVRAEQGLPPVTGGDVVYGSPLQVPLGTIPQSPEPTPPDDSPDEDDEDDDPPQKAAPRRARKHFRKERAVDDIVEKAGKFLAANHDPDAASHKQFVGRVESFVDRLAEKVRDFNRRQQALVMQNLSRITKAVSKGDMFDQEQEVEAMIDFVEPLLKGLFIEQAVAEFQVQGFEGTFNTESERVRKVVDRAVRRLAKSYNSTTANLLKQVLNDGIQEGDGLDQLTERVQSVYEFSNTHRARQVAHTESFYIANRASKEAYAESGVVKTMRWYTAADERVCEFCGPQHGRVIDVQGNFYKKGEVVEGREGGQLPLNYRTIDVPPLHPACRCFVRPERIEV